MYYIYTFQSTFRLFALYKLFMAIEGWTLVKFKYIFFSCFPRNTLINIISYFLSAFPVRLLFYINFQMSSVYGACCHLCHYGSNPTPLYTTISYSFQTFFLSLLFTAIPLLGPFTSGILRINNLSTSTKCSAFLFPCPFVSFFCPLYHFLPVF